MGLFSSWFGGSPRVDTPETLRIALFDAVAAKDLARLDELCSTHNAAIVRNFPRWQQVPERLRADAKQVDRYVQAMLGVAQRFAERGNPALLRRLAPPESNPVTRLRSELGSARRELDECRYGDALTRLGALLRELSALKGSAVERYLPIAHGFVSEAHFHSGDAAGAVAPAETALALCERNGDREGVRAYHGNLYEILRYLGQGERAAQHAAKLAELYTKESDHAAARWYQAQAEIAKRGEPLNRVVSRIDGQRYELEHTPHDLNGSIEFVFHRNRIALRPAALAVEKGERLGEKGDYAGSVLAFERARSLDAFAPEPSYLAGLSLLHLRRYREAVASYRDCETLAPGWFQLKTDLWFAEQLAAGSLEHEVLVAHLELSDGSARPSNKLEFATHFVKRTKLAVFELHRGKALLALGRTADALTAFRAGLSVSSDAGTRTRLLAELGLHGAEAERAAWLERSIELDGNRVATAMARLMLRNSAH